MGGRDLGINKTKIPLITAVLILVTSIVNIDVNANSSYKYLYDSTGRLSEMTHLNGTDKYEYDRTGNLTRKYNTRNLLFNSSFELYTGTNGIADGWHTYKDPEVLGSITIDGSTASSGSRSQKLSASSLPVGKQILIYQDIRLSGNKAYTVSGKYRIDQLTNARVDLYVDYLDAAGNFVPWNDVTSYYSTTKYNQYITLSSSGVTPANTAYIRLYAVLRGEGGTGSGTVYVDQMNLRYETEGNLVANSSFETYTKQDGIADGWL